MATSGPWDEADAPDDGLQPHRPRRAAAAGHARHGPAGRAQPAAAGDRGDPARGRLVPAGRRCSPPRAPAASGTSVREDLATSASGQGGSLREVDGPFGPELAGTIVATPPRRARAAAPQPVRRPARFLGVDGPRWFLRGMLTGPAAADPEAAGALEEAFRGDRRRPRHRPDAGARAAAAHAAGGGRRAARPQQQAAGNAAPAPDGRTLEP